MTASLKDSLPFMSAHHSGIAVLVRCLGLRRLSACLAFRGFLSNRSFGSGLFSMRAYSFSAFLRSFFSVGMCGRRFTRLSGESFIGLGFLFFCFLLSLFSGLFLSFSPHFLIASRLLLTPLFSSSLATCLWA